MSNRRDFLTATGGLGLATVLATAATTAADEPAIPRDLYELRTYTLTDQSQKAPLDAYLAEAAIPALNRIGIDPVGVFTPLDTGETLHVLMRHRSLDSVVTATQKLLADSEYLKVAESFLNAPATSPAYNRIESSLLHAFTGMPSIERPVTTPGRVLQLRIYESPSVKTGQKKIEMFNTGEIDIFRRTGLHPVFFAEALVGTKLPNLTYMLAFESEDQLKANWKTFVVDPAWKALSGKPEYADKAILSGITNILLRPTDYSQI